jgi:DegV family protein with EDD domain
MSKVKILTDSCAYITPAEAEDLGICIVPLNVTIGSETLLDNHPETTERFFQAQENALHNSSPMPRVSSPTPAQFETGYASLYRQTDQILSMHVSHRLSDTMRYARLGAENYMGRCSIQFLDTNSVLLGQGILVRAAAQAAAEGATIDEIVRLVRGMLPHVYTVLYVEEMDFLENSGRIGKAQAILGTMMQIKPLLFMEDGDIIPMEKVKTEPKMLDKLAEFAAEFDTLEEIVIFQRHADITAKSEALLERLNQLFPDQTFPIIQYNPLLASLVGPTATGMVVYEGLISF